MHRLCLLDVQGVFLAIWCEDVEGLLDALNDLLAGDLLLGCVFSRELRQGVALALYLETLVPSERRPVDINLLLPQSLLDRLEDIDCQLRRCQIRAQVSIGIQHQPLGFDSREHIGEVRGSDLSYRRHVLIAVLHGREGDEDLLERVLSGLFVREGFRHLRGFSDLVFEPVSVYEEYPHGISPSK